MSCSRGGFLWHMGYLAAGKCALYRRVSNKIIVTSPKQCCALYRRISNELGNDFIFFFFFWLGDGVSPEKKWRETTSLPVRMMQSFRHFFFRVIDPSPNKTNELIPNHLIVLKHKYFVINRYVSLFISALYSIALEYSVTFPYICHRQIFLGWHKITPIFQPIEKRVT
jgi:hypothetical protein